MEMSAHHESAAARSPTVDVAVQPVQPVRARELLDCNCSTGIRKSTTDGQCQCHHDNRRHTSLCPTLACSLARSAYTLASAGQGVLQTLLQAVGEHLVWMAVVSCLHCGACEFSMYAVCCHSLIERKTGVRAGCDEGRSSSTCRHCNVDSGALVKGQVH